LKAFHFSAVPKGGLAPSPQVAIEVETEHPLIGEGFYVPRVAVTNGFDAPITITNIELIARGDFTRIIHPWLAPWAAIFRPRRGL